MELMFIHKGYILKVYSTKYNTHIHDSYQVKRINDMKGAIALIRTAVHDKNTAIHKRSVNSMIHEWRAHNLLYSLGIKKSRTGSTDLEANQPRYMKIAYFILSLLYPHY